MTENNIAQKNTLDPLKFECENMELVTETKEGEIYQYVNCVVYGLNVTNRSFCKELCKEKFRMQNTPIF